MIVARSRRTNLGPLPTIHVAMAFLQRATLIGGFIAWPFLVSWIVVTQIPLWIPFAIFETILVGSAAVSLFTFLRARRTQLGIRGRTRVQLSALSNLLFLLSIHLVVGILIYGAAEAIKSGFAFTYGLDEAKLSLTNRWQDIFLTSAIGQSIFAVVDTLIHLSLWFLIRERIRKIFWIVFDTLVFVAYTLLLLPETFLLSVFPFGTAVYRLVVLAFVVVRIFMRVLPLLMALIERIGFKSLIAARHLRAKKSGFLAMIGGLSIGAVAVSTCMLIGVLSVMGGFRNDLKEKILGNHAHVLIDKNQHETFEGWAAVLETARETEDVVAAMPFISGEVMLTTASNRGGALLRGIEIDSFRETTKIEEYLAQGRGGLDYLSHPERLLDLPPEERGTILPLDIDPSVIDDSGLLREIDKELEQDIAQPEDDAKSDVETDDDRDELPGILLGKELARTLRLYLGDDVHVISPRGELGPAGPMPKSRRFRVAGVFYSGMYEYDMKHVYMLLPHAQRFLNAGDAISGIEIRTHDVERAPQVGTALEKRIMETRSDLRIRDWQQTNHGLFGALALEKLAMFIMLGLSILIAGFCVFGTLTLMVQEKRRQVGILMALGTSKRSVVSIFMFEGLLIGIYGALIGLALGYVMTFAFERFGIRLNPEVYYIDRLPVHIDPTEFTLVGVIALVICVIATIFPAIVASLTRPVDAIRFQ